MSSNPFSKYFRQSRGSAASRSNQSVELAKFLESSYYTRYLRTLNAIASDPSRFDSHIGVAELFRKGAATIDDLAGYIQRIVDLFKSNLPPVLRNNLGLRLAQGQTQVIGAEQLQATDTDNPANQIVFIVNQLPENGTLLFRKSALKVGQTFTQRDIDLGRLSYQHSGNGTLGDRFNFTITDGTNTLTPATFNIAVNADGRPNLRFNRNLLVNEGAAAAISENFLQVRDADTTRDQIVYTVTSLPGQGTLLFNGSAVSVGQTFTQKNINSGLIRYRHSGSETRRDSFTFTVTDGTTTITNTAFNIKVNPVSDPPVLTTNEELNLDEGAIAPLDSTLLRTFDVDNTAVELVYTVTDAVDNGRLLLDGRLIGVGSTFTQRDLNAGLVNYRHNGSETTEDSFSFTVSDGANRLRPATFNISVNPVNDPPELVNNIVLRVEQGTNRVLPNSRLLVTDAEQGPEEIVFRITAVPQNGFLELNGRVLRLNDTFTQADIDNNRLAYRNIGGTRQLTRTALEEAQPQVSELYAAWRGFDGQDFEIFYYDLATGATRQLTNNDLDENDPQLSGANMIWKSRLTPADEASSDISFYNGSNGRTTRISDNLDFNTNAEISRSPSEPSGTKVIWQGIKPGETDYEIFLYDAVTGRRTQLTDNNVDDINPQVIDGQAIWQGRSGGDYDIFYRDLARGQTTQLTNNNVDEINPKISAAGAIWLGRATGGNNDVFFYDRRRNEITNLTNTPAREIDREVDREGDGRSVVWRSLQGAGNTDEIFLRDGVTGEVIRITNDSINDDDPHASLNNVAWTSNLDGDSDIYFYNGITGETTKLSTNTVNDIDSQLSRFSVIWRGISTNRQYDVFFSNTATSDRFNFTVSDGQGGTIGQTTFNFQVI
jgi:hypothetical protein